MVVNLFTGSREELSDDANENQTIETCIANYLFHTQENEKCKNKK